MNSPAYKAGIRPGDTILKVDGKSCTGLTTTEVADLLKGAKGTTVHISLGREGWDKPIEVTVVRDEIPRPGVEFRKWSSPGIGYVRVSTFNETTDSDLTDALKQLDCLQARRPDHRSARQRRRPAESSRGHVRHVPR